MQVATVLFSSDPPLSGAIISGFYTISHDRVPLHLLPGLRAIAGGAFDEPKWFRIERFGWMRSAHPWVVTPPGVEAFEKGALAQPKQ